MENSFVRCFIAVSLPDNVKLYLRTLQNHLKQKNLRASWPHHKRFHITLAFLGEVGLDRINALQKALDDASLDQMVFQLRIGLPGVFPNTKKARVLWAGIDDETNGMKNIHTNLYKSLGRIGLQLPRKKFVPHITLARFRQPPPRKTISELLLEQGEVSPLVFHVKEIDLYQSILHSEGAVHKKLYTSKLK